MPKPSRYYGRLKGKTALVTGAGSQREGFGTGKAIAVLFAREGARVCLVDKEADRASETLAIITAEGGEAFVSAGDVTHSADCRRFVEDTMARWGAFDILINNVGIAGRPERLDTLDESLWSRTIDVNLKSAILMSRYAVAHMAKQGGGAIVNIASIAGLRAYGGGVAYGPSKAGLIALSQDLAVMYGRDGIRVNAIAPGHIFTPLSQGFLDEEARAARRKAGPLNVEGDAWDVAAATLFLASDEARFITGVCLPVDGGVIATGSLTAHALINEPD